MGEIGGRKKKKKERLVNTWKELKTIMKRYIPKHYYKESFNHLQMITQGSKSERA